MFDYLLSNYIGSPIFILMGIINFLITTKYIKKDRKSALQPYTSGIVASIGFMIIGIVILFMNLLGKW
jgi:hypothetical protein